MHANQTRIALRFWRQFAKIALVLEAWISKVRSYCLKFLREPPYRIGAVAILVVAACFACFFVLFTLSNPIVDDYHFRQSQTAIGIYYAIHEGAVITYETPVLGLPWSAPFEGPIYQSFVAGLVTVTGMDIVPAGRIVSFGFLLGTIYFGQLILRLLLPGDRIVALLFATLMLTSPLYLFWGRATLIETTAIFFGTAWLYAAMRATRYKDVVLAAVALPLCALAALAKMTTWPTFVSAYGLFWLFERRRGISVFRSEFWILISGVTAALVGSIAWIEFSDEIKSTGPLTSYLTSNDLTEWNFGSIFQRFSSQLWLETLPNRMLPDILGWFWFLVLFIPSHLTLRGRYFIITVANILLFFIPITLFANLHLVHAYYQTANALFLIAGAAIALAGLVSQGHIRLTAGVLLLIIFGQAASFLGGYWPKAVRDMRNDQKYRLARYINEAIPPEAALVVVGIDWSSVLHFYSERKGLAVPGWIPKDVLVRFLEDPATLLGSKQVGAVVFCEISGLEPNASIKQLIDRYRVVIAREASNGGHIAKFDYCTVYTSPHIRSH